MKIKFLSGQVSITNCWTLLPSNSHTVTHSHIQPHCLNFCLLRWLKHVYFLCDSKAFPLVHSHTMCQFTYVAWSSIAQYFSQTLSQWKCTVAEEHFESDCMTNLKDNLSDFILLSGTCFIYRFWKRECYWEPHWSSGHHLSFLFGFLLLGGTFLSQKHYAINLQSKLCPESWLYHHQCDQQVFFPQLCLSATTLFGPLDSRSIIGNVSEV